MRTQTKTSNSVVRVISGEKFTPYSLYRKLKGRALLESASFARGKARFSLILVKEAFKVQCPGKWGMNCAEDCCCAHDLLKW